MIMDPNTLPPQVQAKFDDKLLAIHTPGLIHGIACIGRTLPSKSGNTIILSRYDRLPTFPVPLGPSGATPPATPVNRIDVEARISFYGQFIAVNQQVNVNSKMACSKSVLIDLETEVALS